MGNATSIFNLMRNLGGSLGIAASATILDRSIQRNINILGSNVNVDSTVVQSMLARMRSAFMMRGFDPVASMNRAEVALFGIVRQQAALLSFIYVFRFMGIVFLMMLPLVLLMKSPKHGKSPSPMAH
jgi:DHA2 family multidrug resistance protein